MMLRASHCCAILTAFVTVTTPAAIDGAQTFRRTVTYCNKTRDPLVVAVGYDKAGTSESTSEGWFGVAPCACRTILDAELRATEIFVMAAKKGTTTPLMNGTGPLCIHPTRAFTFRAENASQAACQRAGGTWVKFVFHDTGPRTDYRLNYRRQGSQPCNL
jgi:uncharacterized membrane protein